MAAYQSILLYLHICRQISVALLITHVPAFNSWLINAKKSTHLEFHPFFFLSPAPLLFVFVSFFQFLDV